MNKTDQQRISNNSLKFIFRKKSYRKKIRLWTNNSLVWKCSFLSYLRVCNWFFAKIRQFFFVNEAISEEISVINLKCVLKYTASTVCMCLVQVNWQHVVCTRHVVCLYFSSCVLLVSRNKKTLRSIRCNQRERLKNASFDVRQTVECNRMPNGRRSCVFIWRFGCFQKESPYLWCENQPLDAQAHTTHCFGSRTRARAHTQLFCAIFFLSFTRFAARIHSNRFNVSCFVFQAFQTTIFLCLFAIFKLASVQYIFLYIFLLHLNTNYQNHNKNHRLSIYFCVCLICFFSLHSHSHSIDFADKKKSLQITDVRRDFIQSTLFSRSGHSFTAKSPSSMNWNHITVSRRFCLLCFGFTFIWFYVESEICEMIFRALLARLGLFPPNFCKFVHFLAVRFLWFFLNI